MADSVGLLDYALTRVKPRVILGYHRVLPEKKAVADMVQDSMWVSPSNFEKQIQWMTRVGNIVSVDTLVGGNIKKDRPNFAITFDDGWLDNYEYAFPILKKYNIPATIFISTNAIETNEMFWTEEIFYKTSLAIREEQSSNVLNFLKSHDIMHKTKKNKEVGELLNSFVQQLKFLDSHIRLSIICEYYEKIRVSREKVTGQILGWDHIKEMHQHNVTYGSHTHNHMITKGAEPSTIFNEMVLSKKIIEQHLNSECKWFCYPNALFNSDDHLLLQKAGYDYGVILKSEIIKRDVSSYYLPRFIVYQDIAEVFGYLKLRMLQAPFF